MLHPFQTYATCDRGTSGICDKELDKMIPKLPEYQAKERTAALQKISGYIQDNAYMGFITT